MRVLLGVDGSEGAVDTVRRAQQLLPSDRELLVLSVVHVPAPVLTPVPNAAVGAAYASVQLEENVHAQALDAAELAIARIAELFGDEGTTRLVVTGDPGHEICRVAAAENIDLIVVGSHDAGLVRRVVLGSVSDYVVHHAPCAVLVIRPVEGPTPVDDVRGKYGETLDAPH